jgi:antitoxin component of MazEF toxin-antitoxin module
MRKKLIRIGNSLAVVIDKPLRKLMQLSPTLEVEIEFDGMRLTIERAMEREPDEQDPSTSSTSGTERLSASLIRNAGPIANVLATRFAMSMEHFSSLCPGYTRMMRYLAWSASTDSVRDADAEHRAIVRRMHLCYEQLANGRNWSDAVATALRAIPVAPRTPPLPTISL